MIRLGAVDDHQLVLEGLAATLARSAPDIRLMRCATRVPELLDGGASFDVVLLNLHLDDGSSPASNTTALVGAGCRVLAHTGGSSPAPALAATTAGALGVLLKSEPVGSLLAAIRAVAAGQPVVSERLADAMAVLPRLANLLSPQEQRVLRLYAADLPAKSVARQMQVTEGTVKEYLKRIRTKLAQESVRATTKLDLRDVAEAMGLLDGATHRTLAS